MCNQAKTALVIACINQTDGNSDRFSRLWSEVSKIDFDDPRDQPKNAAELAQEAINKMRDAGSFLDQVRKAESAFREANDRFEKAKRSLKDPGALAAIEREHHIRQKLLSTECGTWSESNTFKDALKLGISSFDYPDVYVFLCKLAGLSVEPMTDEQIGNWVVTGKV